jgi:hypothetical protein
MTHDEHCEQLGAYLDGELPAEQAQKLKAAIENSPKLAQDLRQLRRTRELLRELPRHKASDDFVQQVLAQAERLHLVAPHDAAPRTMHWARWAATAAVVAVAVGMGAVVVKQLLQSDHIVENGHLPAVAHHDATGRTGGAGGESLPAAIADDALAVGRDYARSVTSEEAPADADWIVYTDDLPAARAEIEHVLASNGFAFDTRNAGEAETDGRNFYNRNDKDEVVQFEVNGDPVQLSNVLTAVDNLRLKQVVSQAPGRRAARALTKLEAEPMGTGTRGGWDAEGKIAFTAVAARPAAAKPTPPGTARAGEGIDGSAMLTTAAPAAAPASAPAGPTTAPASRPLSDFTYNGARFSDGASSTRAHETANVVRAGQEYQKTAARLLVTLEYRPAESSAENARRAAVEDAAAQSRPAN